MKATKYFSHNELACKATNKVILADGFGDRLDELRRLWDNPLYPSSACRSVIHNEAVGGAKNSFHIYNHPDRDFGTCAIDLKHIGSLASSADRWRFVMLAMTLGWSVGIAKTFIHIDRRSDYTNDKPRIFGY